MLLPSAVVLPLWAMGAYRPEGNLLVEVSIQGTPFLIPSLALVWDMMILGMTVALLVDIGGPYLVSRALNKEFDWCHPTTKKPRTWLSWNTGMAAVLGTWPFWKAPMSAFVRPANLGVAIYAAFVAVSLWIVVSHPNIFTWCDETDQDSDDA